MNIVIRNGKVYSNSSFTDKDIYIEGNRIVSEGKENEEILIDAEGKYVIPGLVDVHFHGCDGFDFCDGNIEALTRIAAYELGQGVTTIIPASMTLSKEELLAIFKNAAEYKKAEQKEWEENAEEAAKKAVLYGIHVEGPFISGAKKGAQREDCLQIPENEVFNEFMCASDNLIKLITVAPEVENAMNFIKDNADKVTISLGHTTANYEIASRAFKLGANHVTHTYNAMMPFAHRDPGVVGAAYDAGAYVEMICDGIHIHPAVIRATFSMMGSDKVVLISDSMMGTGLADGKYQLGGQAVDKNGSLATLADGTIAGSVTDLYHCMLKAIEFGIPAAEAVRAATENPARSVNIQNEYGTLNCGSYANVLILNEDFSICYIIHNGIIVK